jgi:PAS domain S-box-containing protein
VLGHLVSKLGARFAAFLISISCIAIYALLTAGLVILYGRSEFAFEVQIALACSGLVAPPVVFSYTLMYERLKSSQSALQGELRMREAAEKSTRALEDRLLQFVENADEAFFMSSPDLASYEYVSRAYETIWGRSRESLMNAPAKWLRTIHWDDRRRIVRLVTDNSQDRSEFEYRILRPDHEIRWVRSRLLRIRDAEGEHFRTVGFAEDITDRKRAEGALKTQQAVRIRSDRLRSLGEMSAGIAHELNQPLVVRGIAEHVLIALERGWDMPSDKLKDRLSKVIEQSDRMVNIIDHVRLFAREAGKPETQPVNINDVCESALSLLQVQFESNDIPIVTDFEKDLPTLEANPYSLEEVIINLLNNARESTAERGLNDGNLSPISISLHPRST